MVSETDIADIIAQIIPKEILPQTILFGFIYFLLIFYRTEKQWDKYSSFEKVVFSIMSGGIVWLFLLYPTLASLGNLEIFYKELDIKPTDLYPNAIKFYFIIFLYLLIWRLIISNQPLRDNKSFFESTKSAIKAIWSFLIILNFILYLIIISSEYQEYRAYPTTSLIYSFLFVGLFYSVFLEIYGEKIITSSEIDDFSNYFILKIHSINRIWYVGFIILIILGLFTGHYLTKITTQMVDEKNDRLIIDFMFITRANHTLSGDLYVWQNHSIKFGIIPWAKFKPNISLMDKFDKPTNTYSFRGDYLLINFSRLNTTNVILYGRKKINNLSNSNLYKLEISDLNDTIQRWDIIFNNSYLYEIEFNEVIIDPARELRFINYQRGNLGLYDITNEDQRIIIRRVEITPDPNKIYSNRSITLFFEKKIQ